MTHRNLPEPPWLKPKHNDELNWLRWIFAVIASTGLLAFLAKCAPVFRAAI